MAARDMPDGRTDALLLQPCERVERLPGRVLVEHGEVAIAADAPRRAPELDRDDNKPYQPQDEEQEAANHDNRWEQASLEYEKQQHADEQDGDAGDGYVVGEVPSGRSQHQWQQPNLKHRGLRTMVYSTGAAAASG